MQPTQYPPQYPAQPAYAQPPVPQYPPQQPYAQPVPAAYPTAPSPYPQQGYAQPAYPQYAPPAPPVAPLPTGTLDSFYEQPSSGGGPSFKFMDANRAPQIGKSYAGIVARPVTNADVRAQADQNGRPMTYKDGRPKFVLVVPMQVPPSPEFPEGVAGWWVKGQARDELARAMAEAGAPAGPPEAGAGIRVTLVGTRPVPGMNPAYQYRIEYVRPNGAAPVVNQAVAQAPVAQPVQVPPPVQQMPAPQYAPAPVVQPAVQYAPQPTPAPQYVPGGPVEQHNNPSAPIAPVAQPAPVPAQAQQVQQFDNPDQQALFARLTGQPAPQAA